MLRVGKDVWPALSPLLDRALDLDPSERLAFIAAACRTRP